MSPDDLAAWIGRRQVIEDVAAAGPIRALGALLDEPVGDTWPGRLPLLGHWMYFQEHVAHSRLDRDGHPQRGGFLPPVALPRRMWAAGEVQFLAPIAAGATMVRHSVIEAVTPKLGKSGAMVFVTVAHEIRVDGTPAIRETQQIVYREAVGASSGASGVVAEAPPADWSVEMAPDPPLLFRYSAVTFNAHRIHYDRRYAMEEEGYAGLVVHGPLLATLILDRFLRQEPGADVARFSFRALRPVMEGTPIRIGGSRIGQDVDLHVLADGAVAMSARVELR